MNGKPDTTLVLQLAVEGKLHVRDPSCSVQRQELHVFRWPEVIPSHKIAGSSLLRWKQGEIVDPSDMIIPDNLHYPIGVLGQIPELR